MRFSLPPLKASRVDAFLETSLLAWPSTLLAGSLSAEHIVSPTFNDPQNLMPTEQHQRVALPGTSYPLRRSHYTGGAFAPFEFSFLSRTTQCWTRDAWISKSPSSSTPSAKKSSASSRSWTFSCTFSCSSSLSAITPCEVPASLPTLAGAGNFVSDERQQNRDLLQKLRRQAEETARGTASSLIEPFRNTCPRKGNKNWTQKG